MEWWINPGVPIPATTTAIHHITDEMVADKCPFSEVAPFFLAFMEDVDVLVGFNLMKFDIPLIVEELDRNGSGGKWPKQNLPIIDVGTIFKLKEPRDLTAAVAKYCGRQRVDAHSAIADAVETSDVLHGQLEQYPDLSAMTLKELSAFCGRDRIIDWAGKLERRKDGEAVYTLQKVRGIRVKDDPGFGEWMLGKSFTEDTKSHLRALLHDAYDENVF